MLEKIKYINHMNEEIDFGKNGIFVNENDLRDYTWDYDSLNEKITAFKKGIVKKTIPVVIDCENEEDGIKKKNMLFEFCEKDILKMQHGKIVIDDYYLRCYITGSKKKKYLYRKGHLETSIEITTDFPSWIKETKYSFGYGVNNVEEGSNLDFNNDFPMDYSSTFLGKQMNNTGIIDCDFIMTISGACENPVVTISGHEYSVDVSIGKNEYLTIDSIEKTIILKRTDGSIENCFHYRNRDSYIFEKIKPGMNGVVLSGVFKVELKMIEERSEPKWI